MINIILDFINKNHLALTLIINVLGILYSCRQQIKISKELEKYKNLLLVDHLKNEISIRKRFKVYAKLLCQYNLAKSRIGNICKKKQKNDLITAESINQAILLIDDAVAFMVKNSLFISKEIVKLSDSLMRLMYQFEDTIAKGNTNTELYMTMVRHSTDDLEKKMLKELGIDIIK